MGGSLEKRLREIKHRQKWKTKQFLFSKAALNRKISKYFLGLNGWIHFAVVAD